MATSATSIKLDSLITVGKLLPNVDVVIFDGTKRPTVKLTSLLAKNTIINSVPAAFTKVCTESHLASFKESNITKNYKVIFISTDKIPSLEAWKKQQDVKDIQMVSDVCLNFGMATGLLESSSTGLGSILRRSSIVVADGIIQKVNIEKDNSECSVSNAKYVEEQLQLPKEEGKQEKQTI